MGKKALTGSIWCFVITLHTRAPEMPPQRPLPALPQKQAPQTPNFEIQNKHPKTMWITIFNGGRSVTGGLVHYIPGFKKETNGTPSFHNKVIDISKPTYIAVWMSDPQESLKQQPELLKSLPENLPPLPWIQHEKDGQVFFPLPPAKLYTFKQSKTLYLTWDDNGLRPQTGKLNGLAGKTEGGFSLHNNISSNELVEVPYSKETGILLN